MSRTIAQAGIKSQQQSYSHHSGYNHSSEADRMTCNSLIVNESASIGRELTVVDIGVTLIRFLTTTGTIHLTGANSANVVAGAPATVTLNGTSGNIGALQNLGAIPADGSVSLVLSNNQISSASDRILFNLRGTNTAPLVVNIIGGSPGVVTISFFNHRAVPITAANTDALMFWVINTP